MRDEQLHARPSCVLRFVPTRDLYIRLEERIVSPDEVEDEDEDCRVIPAYLTFAPDPVTSAEEISGGNLEYVEHSLAQKVFPDDVERPPSQRMRDRLDKHQIPYHDPVIGEPTCLVMRHVVPAHEPQPIAAAWKSVISSVTAA